MTSEDSTRLGGLLLGQRLVALGVVAEGEPIVGLLPYAVSADAVTGSGLYGTLKPLRGPGSGPPTG
jgi:hypothetical protein